jgi:hypothetical protein
MSPEDDLPGQLLSEFEMIVNLAVKDDRILPTRGYHRLMTGLREVKDSESLVS